MTSLLKYDMCMDVSAPYRAVIPSLDGPVLMTLARLGRPVTGRKLHQLAGVGSEAGVRKVLGRLVEHGLVRDSEAGSSVLYEANDEHVAWPLVVRLAELRNELIDRMSAAIQTWAPPPLSAALFGSAARGDGDISSDIDVVIVHPDEADNNTEKWEGQVDRLRNRVEAWTGNRCQVYELSAEQLAEHVRLREPIVAGWRDDAVTVAGEDFRDLVSSLRVRR